MMPKIVIMIGLVVAIFASSGCTSVDTLFSPASLFEVPTVTVYDQCGNLADTVYVYRHQDDGTQQWYIEDKEISGYPHANPVRLIQTSRTFEVVLCPTPVTDIYSQEDLSSICARVPISYIEAINGGFFDTQLPGSCITSTPDQGTVTETTTTDTQATDNPTDTATDQPADVQEIPSVTDETERGPFSFIVDFINMIRMVFGLPPI